MVDSNNGITNLHVPSDVIIDASMPNVVRDGGQMWNKDDKLEEVKCVIPDRSYARSYEAIIKDCQAHGQFDWKSTGHVSAFEAGFFFLRLTRSEYGKFVRFWKCSLR